MTSRVRQPLREVVVVGAGMIGLTTAWHLQQRGATVTVIDATGVNAGSSWGNAGWLTPSLTMPLPEPAVLRAGLRMALGRRSPVTLPWRPDPHLWRWLVTFAAHCTTRRWSASLRAFVPLNERAHAAYERLTAAVPGATTRAADPFVVGFRHRRQQDAFVRELQSAQSFGQQVAWERLGPAEARALQPCLSDAVAAALKLDLQRFINPSEFVRAIADDVSACGGNILTGHRVTAVRATGRRAVVETSDGPITEVDAVVLANGARLDELSRPHGVHQRVQAGRGYSFTAHADIDLPGPIYFPAERIACTPLGDRLRVAGMMEFDSPDAPLNQRRVRALAEGARRVLRGVDLDDLRDEWVGGRPCTTDGRPLIGASASPRVFVAGGHGMWGVALGPLTGELLADLMTGAADTSCLLGPFDPLR